MTEQQIIRVTEAWVEGLHRNDNSGHDWHHIQRVRRNARRIAEAEGANVFLVDLMALLHDVADRKVVGVGNEQAKLAEIQERLLKYGLSPDMVDDVMYVISNQSFAHSGIRNEKLRSLEGQCMQDADRLDAMGAIGIARCIIYGARHGRPVYDPEKELRSNVMPEEYGNGPSSIHHFPEKLFKLRDLMNTDSGKKLATVRHQRLEQYYNDFFSEWNGES